VIGNPRRNCRRSWLRSEFWVASRDLGVLDLRKEAVPPPGHRFHKARTLRGIAQGFPDFVDRFVEPMVKIHESVGGPQTFLKFLPSYNLSGALKQHFEEAKGLFL
jgi:hypothetical protein